MDAIADALESGPPDEAMKKIGARKFIDFLWTLLHPSRRPEPEADEQFVDPGSIVRAPEAT